MQFARVDASGLGETGLVEHAARHPETHPEGVTLNSPGSRSAPWGNDLKGVRIYPEGVAQAPDRALVQPLRGIWNLLPRRTSQGALRDPGLLSVTPSGWVATDNLHSDRAR